MSDEYLAGLIDGEGYFGLIPSKVKGLKVSSFEPTVKIGMTGYSALAIMKLLQTQYGGHIELRRKLTAGNRQAYTYTLKSRNRVKALVENICPYLMIKQEQAKLLLEFCNLPSSHTRYTSYDPKTVTRKLEIYNEMKTLKQPDALATTN